LAHTYTSSLFPKEQTEEDKKLRMKMEELKWIKPIHLEIDPLFEQFINEPSEGSPLSKC
jgi:hypothetical protein